MRLKSDVTIALEGKPWCSQRVRINNLNFTLGFLSFQPEAHRPFILCIYYRSSRLKTSKHKGLLWEGMHKVFSQHQDDVSDADLTRKNMNCRMHTRILGWQDY